MSLTRYQLIDDTDGVSTDVGAAGTGNPVSPPFTAPALADAQTVAQMFSTMFQRRVRLVTLGGTPPWTPAYTPVTSCLSLISACPSLIGIG